MARTKGSKNNNPPVTATTLSLSLEERIQLIASLVVDTIAARQRIETVVAKEFCDG